MTAGPTDGELVAMTLRGNSEAFATLVERYDRAVYHLAYRTLQDVEEARDATQEAFFKAFRSLRTFKAGRQVLDLDLRNRLSRLLRPADAASTTQATRCPIAPSRRPAPSIKASRSTKPRGCAPRSTRCRRNTGRSSRSFTPEAAIRGNRKRSGPADGYGEDAFVSSEGAAAQASEGMEVTES